MGDHTVESQPEAFGENSADSDGDPEAAGSSSRLSHADERFLDSLGDLPLIGTLPVEEERARMQAGQSATIAEYAVIVEENRTSACPVHLIRPIGAESPTPVIFFLHGGGWVLGDLRTHTRLVCELALRTRSVVAFVEYPRAPEHQFPAPLEACIAAVGEILAKAELLQLDRSRFAIAGDSSGGNLTAVLILSAIERMLPIPACQVLLYPVTDHRCAAPSYREFRTNPNLSQFTMKWFWDNYLPEKSLSSNPYVSPLFATDDVLARFPSTLVVTCEYDVLRDEGERFAARLRRANVDVTAVRWLSSLHGFLVTESLSASASAQACLDMVAQYIRRQFGEV